MSIEAYVGVPGLAIDVETLAELYEALDYLHTQVIDNLGANRRLLDILSAAMDEVQAVIDEKGA